GWVIVAVIPNIYQSSSRVFVDTSSVLKPLLQGLSIQSDLPAQVAVMKQMLLSQSNLEAVVRKTDYAPSVNTGAEMEALLKSIQERTTIESSRENVFQISFEDTNAQRSRNVVQAFLTIF